MIADGNPRNETKRGIWSYFINDLETNIVSNMSKFADDTKLWHRARNRDDIAERQEYINKLVEWANKWLMNFNVGKCPVMHVRHNNVQGNYSMSNHLLRQQINSEIKESSSPKTSSGKNKQGKAAKRPTEYWGSFPAISGTKTKNRSFHYTNPYSAHISNMQCNSGPHIKGETWIIYKKYKKSIKNDSWNQKPQLPPANPGPWSHQPCTKKTAKTTNWSVYTWIGSLLPVQKGSSIMTY